MNRRPVENRGINFALLEGYHTALMKGRYPIACLFLEIDPAAVDVNIHPAKREVKFHREGEVRKLVAQAVRETLLKYHSGGEQRGNLQPPTVNIQRPTPPLGSTIPGHEQVPEALELPHFTPPLPPRPAMFPTKPQPQPNTPSAPVPSVQPMPLPITSP